MTETATHVVRLSGVSLNYGKKRALADIALDIPAGRLVGLIGPDGVGKSSLLSLIAGARTIQKGEILVLGGDMRNRGHRRKVCPRIAYMPQGLGKNLYPTLSVSENVDFFGALFGRAKAERKKRIAELLAKTGLAAFADRPMSQLSGGMKQKLGLCCALIHEPDLLILDEPTTGVDPLSREQFWALIDSIRIARPAISIMVASSYMGEAERFDWLIAMNSASILATGTPRELLERTNASTLDEAFVALLPERERDGRRVAVIPPREDRTPAETIIEADHVTMRFGDFIAVNDVSFNIARGEIFGFVGSNGCGKTTTMKLLTGLLSASSGSARLFGMPVDAGNIELRRRIGYLSQSFSLYSELTVRENLWLHGQLFGLPADEIATRIKDLATRLDLEAAIDAFPEKLPLGIRQRLSLAVSIIHRPDILILDEPTSGVDPIARDHFWQILADLSRKDNVTIFISTHFMNEAERCDRVALMHAGRVLVNDRPKAIIAQRSVDTLDQAFIAYLKDATNDEADHATPALAAEAETVTSPVSEPIGDFFDLNRMLSYTRREALELRRDPIRATLAILGSVILFFVIGYGINMDVERLKFAVLDRDDSSISRSYVLDMSGSRYFEEQAPLTDYNDIDRRLAHGEIALALEIPPGFGRSVLKGDDVEIGAWIDGSMPSRAETVSSYAQGIHRHWLETNASRLFSNASTRPLFDIETRFRYNPAVVSIVAMAPAVMPLLLMLIPAMLSALSVVREKELGSIVNLYVTPVTRLEFLLGKQIPYVVLGTMNFLLLWAFAIVFFQVPFKGSFLTLSLGAFFYVVTATSVGLLMSSFMKSQIAAIFATALITLIPAIQFSGMIEPVSSLQGPGAVIGQIYPTTYFMNIARGTFSKALGISSLLPDLLVIILSIPVFLGLATFFLRKQAV